MFFYIGAIRDLLTKTFNHISIFFCSVFHKHVADCLAALWDTLGNKERKEASEMKHHTHTHFLCDTHKHTSRPVELSVALSTAYSELLENSLLPVFSLVVFAMCMSQCACAEKKVGGDSKGPAYVQYYMSVCELGAQRKTNRRVWCVCICVCTLQWLWIRWCRLRPGECCCKSNEAKTVT